MHCTVPLALLASLALCAAPAARLQNTPTQPTEPAPLVTSGPLLTLEGARSVIAAATRLAHERNVGGAIAVVDAGGQLIAFERLAGTFAAGAEVSIGKARTAALFKKPTRVFEEAINKGRTAMAALEHFTPLIGGIPLVVEGVVVGAVGVSGASSANEDEELALAGAAALKAAPAKVGRVEDARVIPRAQVAEAFSRGATLFSTSGLIVNASRRDGAGEAELHERDLDVFYVLEGHASLVTGGRLLDERRTGEVERRGRAIEGGTERHVRAGDVVVVPAGTPHWFRAVHEPVVYYVVKAS